MKIVLLHYHLNPGGVTRVIESQLDILNRSREIEQVILLTGGCPDTFKPANTEILIYPELGYLDECNIRDTEMQNLYRYLTEKLLSALSGNSILHAHNMNLGKNPVLTYVIFNLVKNGVRMLNHCHDFAEDRPANWSWMKKIIEHGFNRPLREILYRENENCHYAVLTSSDRDRLHSYGLPEENVHLLPNPVMISGENRALSREKARERITNKLGLVSGRMIVTYPVRAIRRKNIGEMILLAAIFSEKASFIVTLPPRNPLELPEYLQWKNFCADEGIDIVFEAGEKVGFENIMLGSDSCITTSVREGFGMAFLEPWIFGTPVIGRDIPSVTRDFIAEGMEFPLLYSSLKVPYRDVVSDFSTLTPAEQADMIKIMLSDSEIRERFFRMNPFLERILSPVKQQCIKNNAELIRRIYSPERYGDRLNDIYKRLS